MSSFLHVGAWRLCACVLLVIIVYYTSKLLLSSFVVTGLCFVVVSVKCLLLTWLYSAWLFWNVFRFSLYSICTSILDWLFLNFITLVFAIVNFFRLFALRVHFAFNQNILKRSHTIDKDTILELSLTKLQLAAFRMFLLREILRDVCTGRPNLKAYIVMWGSSVRYC